MPLSLNMTLSDVLIYLQADLQNSIINDVYPALQANKKEGGYFSVPRLVFCYIDFLGALYSGFSGTDPTKIATTAKAKKYLREVMGLVDPQYGRQADALVEVYRHGTVHLYAPLVLKRMHDNRELVWECYKGTRRVIKAVGSSTTVWITHLKPYQVNQNTDVLPISINCLYDDLHQSIDEYCSLLSNEHQKGQNALLNRFISAANQIVQPKSVRITW